SFGHCRNCGYSLIRLATDHCPECGTKFDPDLLSIANRRRSPLEKFLGRKSGLLTLLPSFLAGLAVIAVVLLDHGIKADGYLILLGVAFMVVVVATAMVLTARWNFQKLKFPGQGDSASTLDHDESPPKSPPPA